MVDQHGRCKKFSVLRNFRYEFWVSQTIFTVDQHGRCQKFLVLRNFRCEFSVQENFLWAISMGGVEIVRR